MPRVKNVEKKIEESYKLNGRGYEQVALLSQRGRAMLARDASFLSIVSFNSTKRRTESFIVSYVGYRFITACS